MRSISANEAKTKFGELLDTAIREPVTIERHGRGVAVVMSKADYDAAEAAEQEWLQAELAKGVGALEAGDYADVDRVQLVRMFDEIRSRNRAKLES